MAAGLNKEIFPPLGSEKGCERIIETFEVCKRNIKVLTLYAFLRKTGIAPKPKFAIYLTI